VAVRHFVSQTLLMGAAAVIVFVGRKGAAREVQRAPCLGRHWTPLLHVLAATCASGNGCSRLEGGGVAGALGMPTRMSRHLSRRSVLFLFVPFEIIFFLHLRHVGTLAATRETSKPTRRHLSFYGSIDLFFRGY
jgi:hypothetical protein